MTLSTHLRDRLPSALAAIALQAGLFALIALSFEAVRQLPEEKETILVLPPLTRPMLQPMVIDARGRRKAPPAQASAEPAAPTIATPSILIAPSAMGAARAEHGAVEGPSQAPAYCAPQSQAGLTAAQRASCPPPPQADANEIPLHPDSHVKDEPYWEAERENSKAPFALPGAAGGPLGILLTALFNPSAFDDKHSYSYGPSLLPKEGAPPDPNAPPPHVSDDAFKKALQAYNARQRALYGRPAPATAASPAQVPQAGGGP